MAGHRVFSLGIGRLHELYVTKVERKGRSAAEVDQVITWLTGYDDAGLAAAIAAGLTLEEFFDRAPRMNPNAALIRGTVCGVKVQDVADPLMQKIRYLDLLVDELARGKTLGKILRAPVAS